MSVIASASPRSTGPSWGRSFSLAAAILALCVIAVLGGCGDGGDGSIASQASSGGSPEYELVLHRLRDAAAADSTYDAVRHAKALAPSEKAAVEAFCYFAWQIGVNHEASKLSKQAYVVGRIRSSAEYNLPSSRAIPAAIDELERVVDLTSLDAGMVARYAKACER